MSGLAAKARRLIEKGLPKKAVAHTLGVSPSELRAALNARQPTPRHLSKAGLRRAALDRLMALARARRLEREGTSDEPRV